MARSNLASMSVDSLLKLRDDIEQVLSRKAEELRHQLASLGGSAGGHGPRTNAMKGRKVAPKYRNPKNRSETWAGRGAMPRWLAAEIKKGKKLEYFAIERSGGKVKRKAAKKARRKRKVRAPRRKSAPQSKPAIPAAESAAT